MLDTERLLAEIRADEAHEEEMRLRGESTAGRSSRVGAMDLSLCAKKAAIVIQEAALANSTSLVDRGILEEIVQDNRQRFAGCLSMPLTFIFFALYVASAALHEDITNVHLLESPLREALVPPLETVLVVEDVWDWLENKFVPIFFKQTNMYDEPIPPDEWSRVFTYNQLQGAVAFEQVRSKMQPCDHELAAHMWCYPQTDVSTEPFGKSLEELGDGINRSVLASPDEGFAIGASSRRLRITREEIRRWLPGGGGDEETFKFFLHPSSTLTEIKQRIDYLKLRGWLDEQTMQVVVKALVLNAEIGLPRIQEAKAIFSFSRGGGVFGTMRFETLFLRAWSDAISMAVDALFIMVLIGFTISSLYQICKHCKRKKCKEHMSKMVNILGLVNIIGSWLNVLGFLMTASYRKAVNENLEELVAAQAGSQSAYELAGQDMHNAAGDMVFFTGWYRLLITYMNIMLMFQCFLVLEFQPRLAVVIATLKATSIDLAHFLVVFIPTFLAYAIAGMCIFGRRVPEFQSLERAVGTCFKIAIESEFDWNTLASEDWVTTASWVWTFMLLIVLLMLNMVLAIIMDVYTEVRTAAGNSETVWENIKFVIKRLYLWRLWVSDETLLESLSTMPRALTDKEFRNAFPDMTEYQFRRLMARAAMKASASMRTGLHSQFLAHMTAAIKVGLDRALKALMKLKDEQKSAKVPQRRGNRVCIEDIMQSIAVQNHWMASVQTQLDGLRLQTRSQVNAEDGASDVDEPGIYSTLFGRA